MPPLTDTSIKNAKPRAKPYRLSDEKGLYLEVAPSGGKWWRFKYRFEGKEKRLSLGVYPDTGLKLARRNLEEARRLLAEKIDPSEFRKTAKATSAESGKNSFQAVALEWWMKFSPAWSAGHGERIKRRLELDVFPWIGSRPAGEITPPELLMVVRRIENRGALETAHRALHNCGQVFRYAVATGRAERDPSADLRGALPPVKEKHHASLTKAEDVAELLRVIDGYHGSFVTQCALRLAPLVFVRPGELRQAEWAEIDLEGCEWRIPAEKMKAGVLHIVPLSRQAVSILCEIKPLTGRSRYVFPCARSPKRAMSGNAVLGALRRLGYLKDEMTGHGFRSLASTRLNEMGWNRDAIERQLAHGERDPVRAAYNYAEHLPERRKMMQAWADHLDALKAGNVIQGDFTISKTAA